MRSVPPGLATAIAGGATTLCRCWRLQRRDGVVLGFTDHDRDLTIDNQLFEAASGLDRSAIAAESGLASQGGEISGALSSARILPEEIEMGYYDGAEIRAWLVDWQRPALDFLLEVTTLGEIRRTDGRFVAELRDPMHRLDQERGRRYTLDCAAELGDTACTVSLTSPSFSCDGTIGVVSDGATFTVPGLANYPEGHFSRGLLRFTSGFNAGLVLPVREHRGGGVVALWQALMRLPLVGHNVRVTAGCDKTFATCRSKFNNALNFRGFPYLPQPEFVVSYARSGEGTHQGRPLVT